MINARKAKIATIDNTICISAASKVNVKKPRTRHQQYRGEAILCLMSGINASLPNCAISVLLRYWRRH
jgi:hypothetical protein